MLHYYISDALVILRDTTMSEGMAMAIKQIQAHPTETDAHVAQCGYGHHQHDHSIKHHSHDNSLHDTHTHSISTRLADAEAECVRRGTRWTPLRREVLQLILQAGKPIGAYDLLAQMSSNGRAPAPPTVYRSVDFLLEQGFIHRLTSINAFVPCCHPRGGHEAAFLICQRCHRVDEAESVDLKNALLHLAQQGGFVAQHSSIEVAGLCLECQHAPAIDQTAHSDQGNI